MSDETEQADEPVAEQVDEPTADDKSEQVPEAEDKLLSEDEVGALLDGMESGQVEICSAQGPKYAVVSKFNVPQRSRLQSKRLPNLDKILERFAERLRVHTAQTLKRAVNISHREAAEMQFEAVRECRIEPIFAVEFSAAPLQGRGALLIEPELIGHILEGYFGGVAGASVIGKTSGFTYGEQRVASNFANVALGILSDLWQSLGEISPQITKLESSAHLLDIADDAAKVVLSGFDFSFPELDTACHLILPCDMLAAQMPYFRGNDRDEDAQRDRYWGETIRAGLHDIAIGLSATVGDTTMSLGELICLKPGDVVTIDNPQNAIIRAQGVPLVQARFGVHAGKNAVEAVAWLEDGQ